MTNVEKLTILWGLDGIRQRLGSKDEKDDSFDDDINKLSNTELIAQLCGWEIGDESWWRNYKKLFDELERLK